MTKLERDYLYAMARYDAEWAMNIDVNKTARRLIEAEAKTDPIRPEIGREFQLKGKQESWGCLWMAEETGIQQLPDGNEFSWHEFDRNVAEGYWQWRYPEPEKTYLRTWDELSKAERDNFRIFDTVCTGPEDLYDEVLRLAKGEKE